MKPQLTTLVVCLISLFAFAGCSKTPTAPTSGAMTMSYTAPQSTGNGPTVVFNPGNNPDSCAVSGFGGNYNGSGTTIFKNGKLTHYSCHGTLTSGVAVDKAEHVDTDVCHWVFTPGGTVNVTCPHGF